MNRFYSYFSLICFLSLIVCQTFSQCDECIPDIACSSPDGMPTFCPDVLPPAVTGEFYSSTATFSIPSSIEVDGIPVDLIEVSLASLTGVPLGLEIQPNNSNGIYYPSNGEEFGCVTICGTALVAGEYSVNISVDVLANAFGFETSITESFILSFTVLQGENSNSSFTTSEISGCAPLEVELTNSITGPGTLYSWNLDGDVYGSELIFQLTTDNYPAETTWNIVDENASIVAQGGPYENPLTMYEQNICIGNGCYTLNVFDSFGDGMQFGGVAGEYLLSDFEGNTLAEIVSGSNFGSQAQHAFCIYSESAINCMPTNANPNVTYSIPGEYEITLTTTVQQLTLNTLNITSLSDGWSDLEEGWGIWGSPDTYFNITGGELNYTSNYIDDNDTPNFNNLNLNLEYNQEYSVTFYDYDSLTDDDNLGTATFTASSAGQFTISGGGSNAIITLEETIAAQFEDTESIIVYESIDAYLDIDGDGYGDGGLPVDGCDPNNEYPIAFNGQDCNDEDATIYPGAIGTWAGIDNDCNTVIEDDEIVAVYGCMEEGACNFNPEANTADESCEYTSCQGCTDPLATNYNPNALITDNSCIYNACFGDFNNDGVITVSDLLTMLASFGCTEDCETDLSGDDVVSVADLLELLAIYGTECE